MLKIILLFLSVGQVITAQLRSKYCDLCKDHIACDHPGTFSPTCPPDRALVEMTQNLTDTILNRHNDLRNKIADGETLTTFAYQIFF